MATPNVIPAGSIGDFAAGDIIDFAFTTTDLGIPFALAGTPVISIYSSNSTTESASGVTLTTSFDSRTGLNHVNIDTSVSPSFYAAGGMFRAVITAGTVNGGSVVGYVVAHFTLRLGASGGVFCNGSNTGTITISDGLVVNRSSSNSSAFICNATGTGSGIQTTGGGSGNGIFASGGGAGSGIKAFCSGVGGQGFTVLTTGSGGIAMRVASSSAEGLAISSSGNANGMTVFSSGNGRGLEILSQGVSEGLKISGGTTNDAVLLAGGSGASGLNVQSSGGGPAAIFRSFSGDGSAITLTPSGTGEPISATLESGITFWNSLKYMAAALCGKLTGAGTTTVTVSAIGNPTTTRVTGTVDSSGNRSSVTLS